MNQAEGRIDKATRERLEWLWLEDSNTRRAFASKMAAVLQPGTTLPKEDAVNSMEMRLKRIRSDGLLTSDTKNLLAQAFGIASETLDKFSSAKLDELKSAIAAAGSLLGEPGKEEFSLLQIANSLGDYRTQFAKAEGLVQILSMSRPRLLEKIFTPVRVEATATFTRLEPFSRTRVNSAKGMTTRRIRPLAQDPAKLEDAVAIANNEPRLNVLGEPGSGKSTLLRRIGGLTLQCLFREKSKQYGHGCLPVFIELKSYVPANLKLSTLVEQQLLERGFPVGFGIFLWRTGGLQLLIDGLDEVPEDLTNAVVGELNDSSQLCKGARFITSCRKAAYFNQLKGFRNVTLADFENDQIQTFIEEKWFAATTEDRALGRMLWKRLSHRRNVSVLELARTPLLLTFICIVFESESRLPSNRSHLYDKVLRIIMREWAKEKGLRSELPVTAFTVETEMTFLQRIAGPSFELNQLTFEREDLNGEIRQFLTEHLEVPPLFDPGAILDAIRTRQGIFVGEEGRYAFAHTTLHEFLAARYFHQRGEGGRLAHEKLMDVRWREVFMLMAGLAKDGTALLDEMVRTVRSWWTANPKARRLLDWSATVIPGEPDSSVTTAKRLVAITLARLQSALRSCSAADEFALFSGENYDIVLARDLTTMLSPKLAAQIGLVEGASWDVSAYVQVDAAQNERTLQRLACGGLLQDHFLQALSAELAAIKPETHRPLNLTPRKSSNTSFKHRRAAEAWLRGLSIPEELWDWTEEESIKLAVGFHAIELLIESYQGTEIPMRSWNRMAAVMLDSL